MVRDVVIIDHHRKTVEFNMKPRIAYIEPSASSVSELLSEFLEQVLLPGTLTKVEADFLLAGMLLDTKMFTRNTGVRTFSSAMYLRGEGANPTDAQEFFKMEIDDFLSEASFESNVVIYKSVMAIALNEDDSNSAAVRVNAARAADRLLNVEGVLAAFALCRIGDTVHISARSQSEINVQLILEKMGGGGHFDSAGAQKKSYTLERHWESFDVQSTNISMKICKIS
jgi:c-di-AMP phosphodiesterase-like protein